MSIAVTDEYKELMHYTSAGGLAGIISSGCLWATDATFLNDAQEITHFFDARLSILVKSEMEKYVHELTSIPKIAREIEIAGDIEKVVVDDVKNLVNTLRKATLSINQPYLFSLTGTHNQKIQANGLLSQWRGYGVDGGYSIVFNTTEFESLLKKEESLHHYQHVEWGDVFYYQKAESNQPAKDDVANLEEIVRSGLGVVIRGGTADEVDGFYRAITSLSCLYKHWGFEEEHEVRVIVIPVNKDIAKLAFEAGERKPQKTIDSFIRGGMPIPYLKLFAAADTNHEKTRLPIKRVIIGPHRDSVIRKHAVERLLASNGYECEVVCSEIPYIGR
jgi:Protein of unknown function (DUF2971)